jgi:hypothetical protein
MASKATFKARNSNGNSTLHNLDHLVMVRKSMRRINTYKSLNSNKFMKRALDDANGKQISERKKHNQLLFYTVHL